VPGEAGSAQAAGDDLVDARGDFDRIVFDPSWRRQNL
jgi:hypothetical protein